MTELIVESEQWRREAIRRVESRLEHANSMADCGALIRELARLSNGTWNVPPALAAQVPTPDSLRRFGLLRHSTDVKVIIDLTSSDLPPDFVECLRSDWSLRRQFPPVLADGILRRFAQEAVYEDYKTPTQKAAVRALVTMPPGSTLLVTMSTGSGKSLLFQLGLLHWRSLESRPDIRACAVVIVPTVALALDHERSAKAFPGLEQSRAITGDMCADDREVVLHAFVRGEVPLLFMSPEMAFDRCRPFLSECAKRDGRPVAAKGYLAAVVVDEAHIIESWGRSFRPDFQRLPALVKQLSEINPALRCLLLSATVGHAARAVLRKDYERKGLLEIDAAIPRTEFDIYFERFDSPVSRRTALLKCIDLLPRPAVVYTTLIEDADEIYSELRASGYERVRVFTGDTLGDERRSTLSAWMNDEVDLVVANSAFGMGVDKPDVRAVVHACLPESAERYYQEIGRAGRDGHQAIAACLYYKHRRSHTEEEKDDEYYASRLSLGGWLTIENARLRWKAILKQGSLTTTENGDRVLTIPLDARHEHLDRRTGKHNRNWNRNLLNFLQRVGAVEILAADEDRGVDTWQAKVVLLELLSSQDWPSALEKCFTKRDVELTSAKKHTKSFLKAVDSDDDCILASVFRSVETAAPYIGECGRCPWCRQKKLDRALSYQFGGTCTIWSDAPNWASCLLPTGTFVWEPTDQYYLSNLPSVVERLVCGGFEQFIVPRGVGKSFVDELAKHIKLGMRPVAGFVLEVPDLISRSWALANLPTAVLLSESSRDLNVTVNCFNTFPVQQTLLYVAPAGLELCGRPLAQIVSNCAPLGDDNLIFVNEHELTD